MSTRPTVSVIIPTRNRVTRLLAAIESVRSQTLHDLEIIVVDDASTDGTATALAALAAGEPRLCVLHHDKPLGAPAARNRGIERASGRFVAFLDDDDEWLPNKAERQVEHLLAHPEEQAVSCHHELLDHARGSFAFRGPTTLDRRDLLWDNFAGSTSLCMMRTPRSNDGPRFDEQLASMQDWDLWMQCGRRGPIGVVPAVLARHVAHADERITTNAVAQVAGRRAFLERYSDEMSPRCLDYQRMRLRLAEQRAHRGLGELLQSLGHARASTTALLAACAAAGRLGWRTGDPGRGARLLHRAARRDRSR